MHTALLRAPPHPFTASAPFSLSPHYIPSVYPLSYPSFAALTCIEVCA